MKRTWKERFEQFDSDNPIVFQSLVNLAYEVKNAGFKRFSIQSLYERLRWYFNLELKSSEPFKINENFKPFYVRKMITTNPDLKGLFELRKLRAI